MKKWLVIILVMMILVGCVPAAESDKLEVMDNRPVIAWNFSGGWSRDEEFTAYFNELLEKYGCNYQVKFSEAGVIDIAQNENGFWETFSERQFAESDIITFNDMWDVEKGMYFGRYARQGKLLSLEPWLESELGQQLKASYPEVAWKAFDVQGETMGVATLRQSLFGYIAIHNEYLERYGIEVKERSMSEWIEVLNEVVDKERARGKEELISYVPEHYILSTPSCENLMQGSGIVMRETDEKYYAVSQYEDQEITDLWQQNYENIRQGHMSFLKEMSECVALVGNTNHELHITSLYPDEDLTVLRLTELDKPFAGEGIYTAISSQTDQADGAFEVLALCFSVPELTDALAYGIEGTHYERKGGQIHMKADSDTRWQHTWYGNGFVRTPLSTEPSNLQDLIGPQFETCKVSPFLSFCFNPEPVADVWNTCVEMNNDYSYLWNGISNEMVRRVRSVGCWEANYLELPETLSADLEQAQKALDEAGFQKVLDEVNRQLAEWQAAKGE